MPPSDPTPVEAYVYRPEKIVRPPVKSAARRVPKTPKGLRRSVNDGTPAHPSNPLDSELAPILAHRLGKPRGGVQPNKHIPTPELRAAVERAVGLGLDPGQIAYLAGISVANLNRNYKAELEMGAAVLQAQIASNMVSVALDKGDRRMVEAAKYVLSRRFGWAERTEIDLKGKVEVQQNVIDARALTDEQRGDLRALLAAALMKQPDALIDGRVVDAEYDEVDGDEAEYDGIEPEDAGVDGIL